MKKIKVVLGLSLLLVANSSFADTIFYSIDNIGGNTWQYNYTMENTGAAGIASVDSIIIYFELGLTENLAVTASPDDWDSLVFDPDPFLPDDGAFDTLALVAGIGIGESLGGFSVTFDFLGMGTPGDQLFEIFDIDFQFLTDGVTMFRDDAVSVPEPASISLFAFGLFFIALYSRRKGLSPINARRFTSPIA